MQWWLTVFFFINGQWVPGSAIEGWQPRPFESAAHCEEHRAFGEKECRDHPLQFDAVWVCSPHTPATEPPINEPVIEC